MPLTEAEIIKSVKDLCQTFPKSSKTFVCVVHRESDAGAFDRTVERAAVISMKNAWKLENKNPTVSFAPSDEKVIAYIKTVAAGAAQAAVQMLVVVELPANKTSIFVLPKSMCFIATAAYGSPLSSEVIVLSQFRDDVLFQSGFGTRLVHAYYRISPPIAIFLDHKESLKALTRSLLRPILYLVRRRLIRSQQ